MRKKIVLVFLGALLVLAAAARAGLEPRPLSERASVAIDVLSKPNITDALLKYLGWPTPEMDIVGTNLGAVQGTKNVQVDGTLVAAHPGWSIMGWSDARITLQAKDIIPWEHVYKIAIVEGSRVISNVLSKRFLYTIDGLKPATGLVGFTVKVYIWDLPPAPGGLVLKMGSYNFTILSWGNPIEAKVPAVPVGTYEVFLQKGRNVVSQKASFKVIKLVKPLLDKQ